MNKFMKSFLLAAILTVGLSSVMQAQKFGYINSQELLSQLPEVKESTANIETLKKQLQKKGQDMVAALQQKYTSLQADQEQGRLSPVQLEQEATKLKEEESKIAQFEQTSQQKIYEKTEQLLSPIQERVNNAIKEVAQDNGYTYIFDTSLGMVLYADPGSDVSAKVKAKLGI